MASTYNNISILHTLFSSYNTFDWFVCKTTKHEFSSFQDENDNKYKTELCRPFTETGKCKYGDKCQFSHGLKELRLILRHPKYKTEFCRTFHTTGFCPYGPRCHFVHDIQEVRTIVSTPQSTNRQHSDARATTNSTTTTTMFSPNSSLQCDTFTSNRFDQQTLFLYDSDHLFDVDSSSILPRRTLSSSSSSNSSLIRQ